MPTPVILSTEDLEELCNYLSTLTYHYYPIATDFFHDLYITGCRPTELLQSNYWQYVTSSDIRLSPRKGNLTRFFTEVQLSTNLVFSIQNSIRPYNSLSLRQLTSVLKKILPVPEITSPHKSAIDYMFRYNRVKQFAVAGKTDLEISTIFGWNNALMATSYRTAIIYASEPIPPYPGNKIIDNNGDSLIDSNGSQISFP